MSEPSALYSRQLVHTFRTNDFAAAVYHRAHTYHVSRDTCTALQPGMQHGDWWYAKASEALQCSCSPGHRVLG